MPPPLSKKRIYGYVAGVISALQALIYFIFSLICLIYYYKDEVVAADPHTFLGALYLRFIDSYFFFYYFTTPLVIEPYAFAAFNWIYLPFNSYWFYISVKQIYDIRTNSEKFFTCTYFWTTLLLALLDLGFVICLGKDYGDACTGTLPDLESKLCQNAALPMLFIAAKGFLLWLVNVGLTFTLASFVEIPEEVPTPAYPMEISTSTSPSSNPVLFYNYGYQAESRPDYTGSGYSFSYDLVRRT